MQVGVPQGSVLSATLYSVYINDTPPPKKKLPVGVHLTLFADDICMYVMDRKEGYVLRKLQGSLNSTETICKHWNVKITEDIPWAVCFSRRIRSSQVQLTLKARTSPL
jgi:hypothetical protein